MKLWHAGIAVEDLQQAINTWASVGFTLKHKFEKDEPAAHAAMLTDEAGNGLELWQFTADSPLNQYVGRHVAFLSEDIDKDVRALQDGGFEIVIPYTEGIKANYVFMQDKFGIYYEIAKRK